MLRPGRFGAPVETMFELVGKFFSRRYILFTSDDDDNVKSLLLTTKLTSNNVRRTEDTECQQTGIRPKKKQINTRRREHYTTVNNEINNSNNDEWKTALVFSRGFFLLHAATNGEKRRSRDDTRGPARDPFCAEERRARSASAFIISRREDEIMRVNRFAR